MTSPEDVSARDRPWVGVVGSGTSTPRWLDAAEAIGRHLAELGAVLVTGGRGGVMEAANRGYEAGDGPLSVGILPGTDRGEANPHVDVPVVTGLGDVRNALVAGNSDVLVALPGSGGTLTEIGFARIRAVPIVGVGAWERLPGVDAVEDAEAACSALDTLLRSGTRTSSL